MGAAKKHLPLRIDPELKALIPPLSDKELAHLEANIVEHGGARDPLVVWFNGGQLVLLDGHNRYEICTRLSLPYRLLEMEFEDKESAADWMDKNQLGRRNLSPDHFRLLLGRRFNRTKNAQRGRPLESSQNDKNNAIKVMALFKAQRAAQRLAMEHGVGQATVERAGEFAKAVDEVKESQPEVVAQGEAAILREAKKIKRQRKEQRMQDRKKKAAKAAEESHKTKGKAFQLLHGDLGEAGADIPDASIDVIVTDPPYPEKFLDTFSKLSKLAARVLKPGGHCLVMSGQSHLPQVYQRLCEHLKYQWTINYYTPGQSTQVFGRKVKSNWKPVIWLIKGKNEWEHIQDTIASEENDKRFHKWGQSVSGIAKLIELFSVPHQTILDPFVGGGTTAVAALATNRTFVGIDVDGECIAMTAKRINEMEAGGAA